VRRLSYDAKVALMIAANRRVITHRTRLRIVARYPWLWPWDWMALRRAIRRTT
jgi:hypothetical protein